jgi:hypothetical protein
MFVEEVRFLERIRFRGIGSFGKSRPLHSCGRRCDERPDTCNISPARRRAGPSGPPPRATASSRSPPPLGPNPAPLLCVFVLPSRFCVKLLHRPHARNHAPAHASLYPRPIENVKIALSREMWRQAHGTELLYRPVLPRDVRGLRPLAAGQPRGCGNMNWHQLSPVKGFRSRRTHHGDQ